jgi:hypothetical protein
MNRWAKNICFAVVITLGLGNAPQGCWCQREAVVPQANWYWSDGCRQGKTLQVDVLLDGKSIYRSFLVICRINSADVRPEEAAPNIAFSFKGGHTFQDQYRTTSGEAIEGKIWQVGREPDGLLLGVSFSTKHQVLLNSIHFAKPDSLSESELDPGLVIRTHPTPARVSALNEPRAGS